MKTKTYILMGLVLIAILAIISIIAGVAGINEGQCWVYVQYPTGTVKIIDDPGVYLKWFGKKWTYDRYIEFIYNDKEDEGEKVKESIRVTYNDGGTADVSAYIRIQTPITKENRIKFHQQFGGNKEYIKMAVKAYMIDCMKSTAPLMSASENQSARKTEFRQVVEAQLTQGSYAMKRLAETKRDITDITGEEITIFKTELLLDDNNIPIIQKTSPLIVDYKIAILQFSVTGTEYDPKTREQFAAKKDSFLLTEKAKADRQKESQTRLMIEERGKKEVSEAKWAANVIKEKAVIEAQQKAEVALQAKKEQETKASMALEVEKIRKQEAETRASKMLEVAKLDKQAAMETKLQMIALAEGKEQAIKLSGEITNLQRAKIDAEVKAKIGIAAELSKIAVPGIVMTGGGTEGSAGGMQDNLMALVLLKMMGGDIHTFGKIQSVSPTVSQSQ